jgi:cystathionine beta-lyase/cystathionine gamma-synthase
MNEMEKNKNIDRYRNLKAATRAVHSGTGPDPATGAVVPPIYQTSTYAQDSPGKTRGFEYSRTDNPTRTAYQTALASLESAEFALAFSSGMAAVDTIMRLLQPGDRVLSCDDLYGGTYRIFTTVFKTHGLEFDFADLSGDVDVTPHLSEKVKLIWLETPTNPLLKICDIERISEIARKFKIPVVVDNTFLSPVLQSPFEHGADIVVHSATKYIGGHCDTVGGAIVTNDEEMYEKFKTIQNSVGAVPGPFDCFIMHRGIKTLPLRMERHCENALKIAKYLESHSAVNKVIYPFLENHPHYSIAKRQQRAGGGMVSFEMKDGLNKAIQVASGTEIFVLAESLGGVESLIEHPAVMTHSSIPPEVRAEKGLNDSLVRLSVGIENADDLIKDLERALT